MIVDCRAIFEALYLMNRTLSFLKGCCSRQPRQSHLNHLPPRPLPTAKYTIQSDQNVQRTMQFLGECPLLRIEDVLPFFPDFVTIDDFKEAICDSLQAREEGGRVCVWGGGICWVGEKLAWGLRIRNNMLGGPADGRSAQRRLNYLFFVFVF